MLADIFIAEDRCLATETLVLFKPSLLGFLLGHTDGSADVINYYIYILPFGQGAQSCSQCKVMTSTLIKDSKKSPKRWLCSGAR